MDRREALKRLAVGGAIASGGSLVLSSNAVAATASGPVIPGIPSEGEPLPGIQLVLSGGDKQLTFRAPPPPAGVVASYGWNIQGYDVKHPQVDGMLLTSGGGSQRLIGQPTCGNGCSYFAGSDTAVAETIFKSSTKPAKNKKFKNGDTVDVGLMVTWTSSAGTVTAEFVITAQVGSGITSSAMVPESYYVT